MSVRRSSWPPFFARRPTKRLTSVLVQGDQVEIRARAVRVAVGAAREVGEHREGAREGEHLVRGVAAFERMVPEVVDAARHREKRIGDWTGIPEIQRVVFVQIGHAACSFRFGTTENGNGASPEASLCAGNRPVVSVVSDLSECLSSAHLFN